MGINGNKLEIFRTEGDRAITRTEHLYNSELLKPHFWAQGLNMFWWYYEVDYLVYGVKV